MNPLKVSLLAIVNTAASYSPSISLLYIFSYRKLIDGKEFLELSRADVQRMVKPLGLVNKIMRLIPNVCVATYEYRVGRKRSRGPAF